MRTRDRTLDGDARPRCRPTLQDGSDSRPAAWLTTRRTRELGALDPAAWVGCLRELRGPENSASYSTRCTPALPNPAWGRGIWPASVMSCRASPRGDWGALGMQADCWREAVLYAGGVCKRAARWPQRSRRQRQQLGEGVVLQWKPLELVFLVNSKLVFRAPTGND